MFAFCPRIDSFRAPKTWKSLRAKAGISWGCWNVSYPPPQNTSFYMANVCNCDSTVQRTSEPYINFRTGNSLSYERLHDTALSCCTSACSIIAWNNNKSKGMLILILPPLDVRCMQFVMRQVSPFYSEWNTSNSPEIHCILIVLDTILLSSSRSSKSFHSKRFLDYSIADYLNSCYCAVQTFQYRF